MCVKRTNRFAEKAQRSRSTLFVQTVSEAEVESTMKERKDGDQERVEKVATADSRGTEERNEIVDQTADLLSLSLFF